MSANTDSIEESFAECRRITRQHAKSFYFASRVLPAPKRRAAYAVYAFCRYADDMIDEVPENDSAAKCEALECLKREFAQMMRGEASGELFAPAFMQTVNQYAIPHGYFEDLIYGVGLDTGRVRIESWEELRQYCYYVASVVGLIMSRIFGLKDAEHERHAVDLGIAMQLTNIIRDIREDFEHDRIYIPKSEIEEFGLEECEFGHSQTGPALQKLVAFQVRRARAYYTSAEPGITALDDDGSRLAVWTMRHVYSGILDEVEKSGYCVLERRVATSLTGKLNKLAMAWNDLRKSRRLQKCLP